MSRLTKERLLAAGATEVDAVRAAEYDWPECQVGHLLVQVEAGERLVLAYDADVPLVLDGGRVMALDGSQRLVNTNVSGFIDVLARYQRYVREVLEAVGDVEGERIARCAAREMACLDPAAFADDRGYWPVVCAQMIEGNL